MAATGAGFDVDAGPATAEPRTRFFCRQCQSEVMSDRAPTGWRSLLRYLGDGPRHCGLFCSEACVAV
jgi:hypothetical protein